MKKFYVDYTNGSLGNSKVKFHGGGDFCRFILGEIDRYKKEKEDEYEVVVLWPQGIEAMTEEDKKILLSYNIQKIRSINEVKFQPGDILFFPLIDTFGVGIISKIKKSFPYLKVYCVLHGVRLIDVCKYDPYDKYYYSGIMSNSIILWTRRYLAASIAKAKLKRSIPRADRVYTVSNNSMQQINHYSKPKYIKYITRNITAHGKYSLDQVKSTKERYALFINANRYEKNFVRSLIAFLRFKEETNSDLKMYVVGMKSPLKENIKRVPEINWEKAKESVLFFDYVDSEKLQALYHNCQFLLYTSKSEGYGLPPLEAMNEGRPTVASGVTSIPEVLGFAAYYINPYNVNSIKNGIAYMDKKENQLYYTSMFSELKYAFSKRGEEDIRLFVRELFSDNEVTNYNEEQK